MSKPTRVILYESDIGSVGHHQFSIDILTDGVAPPLVTLDTNIGYPAVRDFYARAKLKTVGGANRGHVGLTIRFNNPISAAASKFAVTVFQADAVSYSFP